MSAYLELSTDHLDRQNGLTPYTGHELLGLAALTPGLGAWSYGYYKKGMAVPDERVRHGIRAFKQEMIYHGPKWAKGINLDLPEFGSAIDLRTKEFQASCGLTPDGHIGPRTARYLFWTRANRVAIQAGIPNRFVARLITLESANDPVAQGYVDNEDEGGAQIHMPFNPDVTIEQAHDPAFYYPWLAGRLVAAALYINPTDPDYDGAVAAHNVGTETAKQWCEAGKPASLVLNGFDWGARATTYLALVKRQPIFG